MSYLKSDLSIELDGVITTQKAPPPNMYKVLLLNDDFTPMDFVVEILEQVFFLEEAQAVAVMLTIHHQGRGLCGIYAKDVAETKVDQVSCLARNQEYPLKCIMEEEK
jgi:ATP-dependent Clp protease adaptor protein ClpS